MLPTVLGRRSIVGPNPGMERMNESKTNSIVIRLSRGSNLRISIVIFSKISLSSVVMGALSAPEWSIVRIILVVSNFFTNTISHSVPYLF